MPVGENALQPGWSIYRDVRKLANVLLLSQNLNRITQGLSCSKLPIPVVHATSSGISSCFTAWEKIHHWLGDVAVAVEVAVAVGVWVGSPQNIRPRFARSLWEISLRPAGRHPLRLLPARKRAVKLDGLSRIECTCTVNRLSDSHACLSEERLPSSDGIEPYSLFPTSGSVPLRSRRNTNPSSSVSTPCQEQLGVRSASWHYLSSCRRPSRYRERQVRPCALWLKR